MLDVKLLHLELKWLNFKEIKSRNFINQVKRSKGLGRPWIQEGGPFERSSGFFGSTQKWCNLAAHLHFGRLSADRHKSESLPFSL